MWKTLKEKSPFFRAWFGDWRANDTKTTVRHVTVQSDTRGLHRNIDTGWDINHSAKVHTESHNSKASISGKAFLPYIDGIIENAVLLNSEISDNENENSIMFHSLYSVVNDGDNKAIIKLIVEEMKNPGKSIERRAYKLVDIEKLPTSALGSQNANLFAEVDSINNISQLIGIVKAFDKSYNPKPSSVVVDENGMPKKVYHSTSEKFDTFDITKSRSWDGTPDYDLPGFYFSESYDDSAAYGDIVGEYYIKITKPYEGDVYSLRKEKGTYRAAYDYLVSQGYDGVIIDEYGEGAYEYIVLKDVNIKSATDNIGTFDSSNANTKMSKELSPDEKGIEAEYLNLAKNPKKNEAKLHKLVTKAARAAGYNSPLLYHGTGAFGFTEFDLSKSDDGRTIFLTSNEKIASTYSGVTGTRKVSDVYDKEADKMSLPEISDALNEFVNDTFKDAFEEAAYNYSSYDEKKLDKLVADVDKGLKDLGAVVDASCYVRGA